MNSSELKTFIEIYISAQVDAAKGKTPYRPPLVGFATARDPRWLKLREIAEPTHLLPTELLPRARTVVAFFIPFGQSVVKANRRDAEVAPEWTVAYNETNALINRITGKLVESLGIHCIRAATQSSTHNWDPKTLVTAWSHKSAAAIAGLGTFGYHRMLITELGCAGRCGSLVMDAVVKPAPGHQPERCLRFAGGNCSYCVDSCPVGALTDSDSGAGHLDKMGCYRRLLEVEARQGADACGKCAVGPCALCSATKG